MGSLEVYFRGILLLLIVAVAGALDFSRHGMHAFLSVVDLVSMLMTSLPYHRPLLEWIDSFQCNHIRKYKLATDSRCHALSCTRC